MGLLEDQCESCYTPYGWVSVLAGTSKECAVRSENASVGECRAWLVAGGLAPSDEPVSLAVSLPMTVPMPVPVPVPVGWGRS